MANVSYKLKDLEKKTIRIGYVGENNHMHVRIDCEEVFKEYPNAAVTMAITPPEGEDYPKVVTREGNVVEWTVANSDVAAEGYGEFQMTFTEGEVIRKTVTASFEVIRSIVGNGTAPSGIDDFLTDANAKLAAVDEAIQDAEDAASHAPIIGNDGYWYRWDADQGEYVSTGTKAQGEQGDPGIPGDPTQLIDDTAGEGATGKTWSADKLDETTGQLLNAIQGLDENAVQYVLARKIYVGENLISNETTVIATGWSGSIGNGFTHSSGNTNPLTFEVSTTEGNKYIVEFDWTNYGEGRIGVGIGDSTTADPYNGTNHAFVGFVADGGYLKINPISSYTGTIENVKIRPVEEYGDELIQQCKNVSHGSNENEISGWFNVVLGPEAMRYNQNGTRNMAVGYGAMQKLISGNRNVAIGTYAMPFVSKGESNIAIGSDTIYNWQMSSGESIANNNIAIGKATMRNGNLIEDNIAIGKGAMSENALNAKENIAIGTQAGYNASQYNTLIGVRAGYYFNGDGGESNTCIGHEAGFSPNHNGKNNVFIGKGSRPLVPGASASTPKTVNNSVAIGKDAKATKSYQVVIGNTNITEVVIAGKILSFNEDGTVTWSEQ